MEELENRYKRTKEALRLEREKLCLFYQNNPDPIIITDTDQRIVYANRKTEEITGIPLSRLKRSRCFEAIMGHDGMCDSCEAEKVIHSLEPRILIRRESTAARKETWFQHIWYPLFDRDGRVRSVVEIIKDITEVKRTEARLQETNEMLRALIQASPIAILACDLQGNINMWNRAAELTFGWTEGEILGRPNPVCPQEKGEFHEFCRRVRGGEVFDNLELILPRRDRSSVEINLSTAPLYDSSGNISGSMAILSDITQRKKVERALRHSEDKFSKVFRYSPDWISISSLSSGRFIDVNDACLHITGFSRDEIIGRTAIELGIWVDPREREEIVTILRREGVVRDRDVRNRMKSGEIRAMTLSAEIIDYEGEPCLIAITRDTTERKRAERELRLSNEKFSTVFYHSPERIAISSFATGHYIDVNNAFLRYTGFTREEVIGKTALELGIWVDPDQRDEIVNILRSKREVSNCEVRFRNKSGEIHTMLWSAELIEYGEEPCILAITRDITERKRVEEELRLEVSSLKQHLLTDRLEYEEAFSSIITRNKKMRAVFQYMEVVAGSQQPVLITGETGVGKELVARTIHVLSGRSGNFVPVNVAGLDETMFSDTLFGHRKGAYTSADGVREGLIVRASGGTLFLDEIGDMSELSQAKLLRVLQEETYYPLGSDVPQRTDARVVVATNKDIQGLIVEEKFRKDLYFRICAHHIHVPSLRERLDDIPLLVDHFLDVASKSLNKGKPSLSAELIEFLTAYNFPGNVRELRAMVFDAVARHKSGRLSRESFEGFINPGNGASPASHSPLPESEAVSFDTFQRFPTLREAEDYLISEALRHSKGNQRIAASYLGITRQALNKRLHKAKQT